MPVMTTNWRRWMIRGLRVQGYTISITIQAGSVASAELRRAA
jgi:hypothetical protein